MLDNIPVGKLPIVFTENNMLIPTIAEIFNQKLFFMKKAPKHKIKPKTFILFKKISSIIFASLIKAAIMFNY